MQTTEEIPVMFRFDKKGKHRECTAIFPTIPGTNAYDVMCYSHVGQHGTASLDWVRGINMTLFVFLVTMRSETPPAVYVEDYGLSGADCIARVIAYRGPGTPSCEIDQGD